MTQPGAQLASIGEHMSVRHYEPLEIKIPTASHSYVHTKPGASIDDDNLLSQYQQQERTISIASHLYVHTKPCPDLLNGKRKEYIAIAIPLYEASVKGDWKAAKEILDRRPELVRYSITGNDETALHVAASAKSTKQVEDFVENLMNYMEKTDLELKNNSSNTALCLAAASGNVELIKIMMEKNKALVAITGAQGMTPLYMAAMFGHYEAVKYLYHNSQKLSEDCWTVQNRGWLLQKCVENDMFDIALDIVQARSEFSSSGSVLGALARKTDVFAETESNFFMRAFNRVIHPKMQALEKENKAKALEILKTIWHNIAEMPRVVIDNTLRGPPDPPFEKDDKSASDKEDQTLQLLKLINDNIVNMPVEIRNLIKEAPAATTSKDPHRQVDIYNLLHEVGSNRDLITPLKDIDGNNMLHLVGRSVERKRLEDVSGGAFQMQRELLWFKEVEEMIPPSYREQKNKDGLTPRELFTKDHQYLVVKGEEWMKGTASQCMVVAALIATIVFAAAFTVPGGYNQNDGIPLFRRNVSFLIFVVADAISLFSSSASILTFLAILTSRYAEQDFLESLPRKLMLGLATLYLSITTMMVAFSVSFFVLYDKDLRWIPIIVTVIATTPVLLFAVLQYRLLKDVIHSTYGSRYLFRPKKRVLYYENSMSNHRWFPFTIPFISRCTSKILKLL